MIKKKLIRYRVTTYNSAGREVDSEWFTSERQAICTAVDIRMDGLRVTVWPGVPTDRRVRYEREMG